MSVVFFTDVHFPGPVISALQERGVDILAAQRDGSHELLARASQLGRVLLTQDQDFFAISKRWQSNSQWFAGVLFARQRKLPYRQLIEELELIAHLGEPVDFENRLELLPLQIT